MSGPGLGIACGARASSKAVALRANAVGTLAQHARVWELESRRDGRVSWRSHQSLPTIYDVRLSQAISTEEVNSAKAAS